MGEAGNRFWFPAVFLRHVEDDLLMTTYADTLSIRDLNRLCRLIYEQSGITPGAEKKIMLEGRLKRRITLSTCLLTRSIATTSSREMDTMSKRWST